MLLHPSIVNEFTWEYQAITYYYVAASVSALRSTTITRSVARFANSVTILIVVTVAMLISSADPGAGPHYGALVLRFQIFSKNHPE